MYKHEQVANTLRRLFAQGDVQLALEPISAFSLQAYAQSPLEIQPRVG